MVYSPPVKVKNLNVPWKALVMRADPDFEWAKRHEPFYQFSSGRRFDENTAVQGPYSTLPKDNPPFT